MLATLRTLIKAVEDDEVLGLMVTAIQADARFTCYQVGAVTPTNRVGYLMFQIHDLLHTTRPENIG